MPTSINGIFSSNNIRTSSPQTFASNIPIIPALLTVRQGEGNAGLGAPDVGKPGKQHQHTKTPPQFQSGAQHSTTTVNKHPSGGNSSKRNMPSSAALFSSMHGTNNSGSSSIQHLSPMQKAVLSEVLAHQDKPSSANVTQALLADIGKCDSTAKQQRMKDFLQPKSFAEFKRELKKQEVPNSKVDKIQQQVSKALMTSHNNSKKNQVNAENQILSPNASAGALTDQGTFSAAITSVGAGPMHGAEAARPTPANGRDASIRTARSYIPREQRVQDAKIFVNMANGVEQARLATGLHQAAHNHAKTLLIQSGKPDLDPDKVYLNDFSGAVGDSLAYTGWIHTGAPTSSMTLTEVVIRNFLPGEVELGTISGMDQFSDLYKVGDNSANGYGAQNEVQILPSDFMNKLEKNDFSSAYKKLCGDFWTKHGNDYRIISKGAFITAADNAYKKNALTETGYFLVMGAAARGLEHRPSYPGPHRPPISMDTLQAQSPADGSVRKLDVYGYPSNILIFSDPTQVNGLGKQVVYSPMTQQFHEFENKNGLYRWVEEQAKDPVKREAFLEHWSLYNQEDGNTYAGVKTALEGIGAGDASWRPQGNPFKYMQMKDASIKGDLFTNIAKQAQEDQTSNADMLITSNAQVQEAIILGEIKAAEKILLPLALLAPEVFAIPAGIGAGVETGLGIHEMNSERKDDKKQGLVTTMTGLIDGLFSVLVEVPVSEDIPELRPVNFANIDPAQVGGEYIVMQEINSASRLEHDLDLSAATLKEGSTASTANAGSVWKLPNNEEFFVKPSVAHLMKWQDVGGKLEMTYDGLPTIEEQKYFVEKEVVATRQTELQSLHENAAPEAFVGTKQVQNANGETMTEYFVATKAQENFKELGDILVDNNFVEEQLAKGNMVQEIKEGIRSSVNQLRQLQEQFQELKNNDPTWYTSGDSQLKNDIGQMRELRKQVVNKLLPQELRDQLLAHVMNDQVIGELDTVNTWGQNVGFVKTSSGKWQLIGIDRGASYDTGFWGTAKDVDGFSTAKGQRPFILQSDREQIFTSETAKYSDKLPQLGKDFSNYPYPEDIETIAGAGTNEIGRQVILKKLAYQDLLLEGNGGAESAFNKNFEILSEPPTPRLRDRGLMAKDDVIKMDKARRDARIDQAGGKDQVLRWARKNPGEANGIKNLANAKRVKMGLVGVP